MKITFQFDESKAQIILAPSNGYDSTNLENFQAFKGKALKASSGSNKELIIESNMNSAEAVKLGILPDPNPEQQV